MTIRVRVDPDNIDGGVIDGAADLLRGGGLVAFPTETVYGLGCLAEDSVAVDRVFAVKERPQHDPLIIHVTRSMDLTGVVAEQSALFRSLAARHWPGPLTMVVPRGPRIPPTVTAGLATVAIRAPAHPIAEALIEAVGAPVAAPSANLFGRVSPTTADHVLEDLAGRCDLVLDAGDTTLGIESTVVRLESDHVVVLRHGALPVDELDVECIEGSARDSESPGQAVRHYSPLTPMAVMDPRNRVPLPPDGGVYLGYDETARPMPEGWEFFPLGSRSSLPGVAARLYRVLRSIDGRQPTMIVAELTSRAGLGRAIDDRLTRAASGHVLGA
ncbi:MAG: L-threonylcarbamoyladenylate synthase [Acidimicrobiia bacterium]|nr:L-threonylcarbamoyladenylate synthase [Acidimicrobiia bacterium]MDH5292486.1 L-threonylcarbamoyladenylate synthase [Acidimicrobiia bacterium]